MDGSGPVYMNCTRTNDEDLKYMLENFPSEGLDSVVDYMEQYHVDLKTQMIEFFSYNNDLCARGIEISENAATSIPGLFATGNAVGNSRAVRHRRLFLVWWLPGALRNILAVKKMPAYGMMSQCLILRSAWACLTAF